MKRLFMAVIAVLTLTVASAKENNGMDYNFGAYQAKFGKYLALNGAQAEKVSDIQDYFAENIRLAGGIKNSDLRKKRVKRAVYSTLKLMKDVLDEKQYRKYVQVMNLSLRNRGLNVYFEE